MDSIKISNLVLEVALICIVRLYENHPVMRRREPRYMPDGLRRELSISALEKVRRTPVSHHLVRMMDFPGLFALICLLALCLAAQAGAFLSRKVGKIGEDERTDLGVILTAVLTLLGLIIGFTFSMSVSRYNQRKDYEATEANAIGTELARAELLPEADAASVRGLLSSYLAQRISFYRTREAGKLQEINASTAQLQAELWSAVQNSASGHPTPIMALVVSGMNDVLNSQTYTQAAWWNRIPGAAWALMIGTAACCTFLVGYTERQTQVRAKRLFVIPLIVSTSLYLIAEIDSPNRGIVRVRPQNLESVASTHPVLHP